jgi:hypothetical protein
VIPAQDRRTLRDLATRVAEAASQPIMAERRAMWARHNRLERVRPMILVFPEGSWAELLPDAVLVCTSAEGRDVEAALRRRLYYQDHIHDDTVIENTWEVPPVVAVTGWGLQPRHIDATQERGSWAFDPVVREASDLDALRYPEVTYDAEATRREHEQALELFGDILDVQRRGVRRISFHLGRLYADLRGLDQFMWDMYDHPDMIHRAMRFFSEGYRRYLQQIVDLGLLDVNNDGTYHSSGGVGYTDELPAEGYRPGQARFADLWASAESQELALVSPAQHEEFVLQYERELLEPFGLNGYGCCEDLTHKLERVLTVRNMRRISISPWADVRQCAERLGRRAIFSWKPNPAYLVGQFDAGQTREYLGQALEATRGCVVEVILKDTHTCEHHPERFTEWTQVARELAEA